MRLTLYRSLSGYKIKLNKQNLTPLNRNCRYKSFNIFFLFVTGLLRLQQLYQTMQPGKTAFKISLVKRIYNSSDAMDFLVALEHHDRWSNKRIVLDCNARNAKSILVEHVRKVQLGRRTYHYMLSGLVRF